MSFAYLALYTGDYLRDTRHLTPLKHGVYLLLLMHCWDQMGPLPLDEQECAGIANCRSADEVDALRFILNRFFVQLDDGWYNRRIQKEIEKARAISNARSEAGKVGYQAKLKHLPSKSQAIAEQVLSKSQARASTPPPPLTSPPPPSLQKSKAIVGLTPDVAQQAREILQFLNDKAGRRYQANRVNLGFIASRLKDGATVQECRQVIAKKCREWSTDEKMAIYLRPATLFGAQKFSQYQGELVVKNADMLEMQDQ